MKKVAFRGISWLNSTIHLFILRNVFWCRFWVTFNAIYLSVGDFNWIFNVDWFRSKQLLKHTFRRNLKQTVILPRFLNWLVKIGCSWGKVNLPRGIFISLACLFSYFPPPALFTVHGFSFTLKVFSVRFSPFRWFFKQFGRFYLWFESISYRFSLFWPDFLCYLPVVIFFQNLLLINRAYICLLEYSHFPIIERKKTNTKFKKRRKSQPQTHISSRSKLLLLKSFGNKVLMLFHLTRSSINSIFNNFINY